MLVRTSTRNYQSGQSTEPMLPHQPFELKRPRNSDAYKCCVLHSVDGVPHGGWNVKSEKQM